MENLLTVKQVAFIVKVHPLTIRRYIKEKKLTAVKVAGSVRVKESDLQAFNKAYEAESQKPKFKSSTQKTFSFDDPLWRLNGRGLSLTLPTEVTGGL